MPSVFDCRFIEHIPRSTLFLKDVIFLDFVYILTPSTNFIARLVVSQVRRVTLISAKANYTSTKYASSK